MSLHFPAVVPPGNVSRAAPPARRGFTLIELLVSIIVLSLIVLAVANLAGTTNLAWLQGERNAEVYQNGRAVLELMSRELSQAAMSNRLQFVQNPGPLPLPTTPSNEPPQAPASPLFWQAPLANTSKGNLCEVGYYLVRREPTADVKGAYQLKRFFVRPDNATGVSASHPQGYYRIYEQMPAVNAAVWLTGLESDAFSSTSPTSVVTTLSEGTLGLWVRCLDENGDPIPWMNLTGGRTDGSPAGIQFNSAGCFNPAIPGQSQSFVWRNATLDPTGSPATAQTFRLPASVEITIAQVDQRTASNVSPLPTMNNSYHPGEIPTNIAIMQQNFDGKDIDGRPIPTVPGGHIFATRVNLSKQ